MQEIAYEVIVRARGGDESAMKEILELCSEIVNLKSRQLFIIGADRDDVYQEGMIGLLKAVKYYDRERVASFKSFAALCVQRQVLTAIRRATANKHSAANRALDVETFTEELYTQNPEDSLILNDITASLQRFFEENLSKFELDVYKQMMLGLDYREISNSIAREVKAVDNAIQRIRKKGLSWLKTLKID